MSRTFDTRRADTVAANMRTGAAVLTSAEDAGLPEPNIVTLFSHRGGMGVHLPTMEDLHAWVAWADCGAAATSEDVGDTGKVYTSARLDVFGMRVEVIHIGLRDGMPVPFTVAEAEQVP
jgi:hypothetical protein